MNACLVRRSILISRAKVMAIFLPTPRSACTAFIATRRTTPGCTWCSATIASPISSGLCTRGCPPRKLPITSSRTSGAPPGRSSNAAKTPWFRSSSTARTRGSITRSQAANSCAASDLLLENSRSSARPVLERGKAPVVSIILDGENAWEYYPKSGREFLRRFYDALQRDPEIEAVTISEAIARHKPDNFRPLQRLVPGSWIDANFNIWIGSPEDNQAWDLLSEARDYYDRHSQKVSEAQRKLAWEELLDRKSTRL